MEQPPCRVLSKEVQNTATERGTADSGKYTGESKYPPEVY